MTVIERDVPMPERYGLGERGWMKYPWTALGVGESFVADNVRSLRVLVRYRNRKGGAQFRAHQEGERIRVWRVA